MTQNVNASKKNTSKKAKAILAGGLVLGVGAAVTLASWTDQEWASASFSSGKFTLESSSALDGTGFANHSENGGSKLKFELPQASQLGPNEKLAAPLSLRLAADTTHDAIVTMTADVEQQIQGLSYEAIPVPSPQACSTDLPGNGAKNDLGSVPAAFAPIQLTADEGDDAGDPFTLCFVISADGKLQQDQSAKATWNFVGESVTAAD